MQVYLDDDLVYRPTPSGWVRTLTAHETIELLKTGKVVEVSLDHDLGDEAVCGCGYDVINWIEQEVALNGFTPPLIRIHTANSSARSKMELGVRSIEKLRMPE